MRIKNMLGDGRSGGVWALDGAVPRATGGMASRDLLMVPAEQAPVQPVALPLPSHAKRVAALPFALEERVAGRIDMVHLALGEATGDGSYLAAAVEPALMQNWVIAAEEAGLGDAAIMPDALALPVPAPGHWNVLRADSGRILVRTPDGAAFAAQQPLFVPLWTAAGKPECDELPGFGPIVPVALDLRQGLFARPRQGLSATARRVAIVAAAGLLAHGAIAAADTIALRSIAAQRGAEMTALLNSAAPGRYAGSDPREAAMIAAELLPAGGSAAPGTLLPMLSRTSSAPAPFGAAVTIRAIGFDDAGRSLRIDLDMADRAAAASITRALRTAGLSGRFDGGTLIVTGGAA